MPPPRWSNRKHQSPSRSVREAPLLRFLGLLLLGLLVFQGGSALLAQASPSPRQLKEDAITTLEQIATADPKLQRTISQAIEAITRSLADKGQSLFLDDSRLLPPPRGQKVFQRQRQAVDRLLAGIAREETPAPIQAVFQQVITALVEADRAIAALSIATAERLVQTGGGDAQELAKAQRAFDQALQATDPRQAIQGFRKAWASSQEVVEDRTLAIRTFQDTPDPFSPSGTPNTLTATFQIREKGELRHEKEQTRFVLEFVERIQDSATTTVRRLTTRQPIPLPPTNPQERFFDVTVTSPWDGRSENGAIVPDGTYTYLALGHLIKVKSDGKGRAEERIDATTFPVSGTILLDNTPPLITATVTPAPNANGWNNTDVTVSFTCTDATSGVATCPSPIPVTGEGANQAITGTATDLAGNSATVSLPVNLDKTPPSVSITSPADGITLTTSLVTVTGTITDPLSGVASVTCNGTTASLAESTFTCDLSLTEGANPILVQATDLAGNTGSSSLTVTFGPQVVLPAGFGLVLGRVLDAVTT
ncbi:MAG: Ig-like domain-containing protein, partial [Candidatus Methylomirabilales bacterium]